MLNVWSVQDLVLLLLLFIETFFQLFLVYNSVFSSVQFNHSVMSDSLQPHRLQHTRPPCPSSTPRVYSDSCPLVSDAIQPFNRCPLLLLPSIFPSIRVFSDESVLYHHVAKVLEFQLQK